jgi:hypothetical protein
VKYSVATLVLGTLGLWLAAAAPARRLGGDLALLQSAVAALVCLVPAAVTLLWSGRALGGPPEQQLLAVLGGTGLRLFAVLVAGVGLFLSVPALGHAAFLIWLVVFYLITLTLEVVLLVRRHPPDGAHGP